MPGKEKVFIFFRPKKINVFISGGQKRRVSLAAALVHSPPLLILDGNDKTLIHKCLLIDYKFKIRNQSRQ